MSHDDIQILQMQLAVAQQCLALIHKIDDIRDHQPEPLAMLTAIVTLLADEMHTNVCLLALRNRETGDMELKAINTRSSFPYELGELVTRELSERIMTLSHITVWEQEHILPEIWRQNGWQVTAVPIIIGNQQRGNEERLGGLLLARYEQPFTADELELLAVAEAHIDSAIIQGYAYAEREQRLKELETIYHIDSIRDLGLPFDEMLNAVLQELESLLTAEIGFIMLYDQTGNHLEMRAATRQDLFKMSTHYQTLYDTANACLDQGELICKNGINGELYALMCLPLILNDHVIGVLGVANQQGKNSFSHSAQRLLNAVGSQIDTAIFESLEQRRLRRVLGRSVDPRIMEKLLTQSDTNLLEGQRRVLTVLYADVRGSTSLAENTAPEKLVEFINSYLGRMAEVILEYEGTLDKFVGDEVMALFGAPFPQEDHPLRAIRTAFAMQEAHQALLKSWIIQEGQPAPIGIGIASGELIAGEMGSELRTDYTVIGRAANLGARICSAAHGGQILISPETYEMVKERVEVQPIYGLEFKGISGSLTIYQVLRIYD